MVSFEQHAIAKRFKNVDYLFQKYWLLKSCFSHLKKNKFRWELYLSMWQDDVNV